MLKPIYFTNVLGLLVITAFSSGFSQSSGFLSSLGSENVDMLSELIADVRSVYTSIEVEDCQVIETERQSNFSISSCPGYSDIPVFTQLTQHEDYLKIGNQSDRWESHPSRFNSLGKVVEWRLRGDKPFAAIYRHDVHLPSSQGSEKVSYLGVVKITEDRDSCITAFIDGRLPNANEIARNYADENTVSFVCGEQEARNILNQI
ncbi:MAG: hypothetical protein AAFR63_04045 [Cyanobacteria bacterium J06631_6]